MIFFRPCQGEGIVVGMVFSAVPPALDHPATTGLQSTAASPSSASPSSASPSPAEEGALLPFPPPAPHLHTKDQHNTLGAIKQIPEQNRLVFQNLLSWLLSYNHGYMKIIATNMCALTNWQLENHNFYSIRVLSTESSAGS